MHRLSKVGHLERSDGSSEKCENIISIRIHCQ
jgi:hypothetical protein